MTYSPRSQGWPAHVQLLPSSLVPDAPFLEDPAPREQAGFPIKSARKIWHRAWEGNKIIIQGLTLRPGQEVTVLPLGNVSLNQQEEIAGLEQSSRHESPVLVCLWARRKSIFEQTLSQS